jgi:uncharacterized membrane protein YcaP (DUF421 family)
LEWFSQIFGHELARLTWTQECARTVLIFAYGLIMVRLVGRRVFGKWSALDIVVSIIVGSSLSRAMTGSAPLLGTLGAATLLMAMHWLLAQLAARSAFFSRIVEGAAILVARQGAIDETMRRRQSVSMADLDEAVRQKGLARLEDAERVILEPSGKLAVLQQEPAAPGSGKG